MPDPYPLQMLADLDPGDHLCQLYGSEREHRAVLVPFLRRGLMVNEKVVHLADVGPPELILSYLQYDGVDVAPYLDRGQLSVRTTEETYLRQGFFDPEETIGFVGAETRQALSEGYPALRLSGEMGWALRGSPGCERLIDYEAMLNRVFPTNCLAMCQYDRSRFDSSLLLDVLRTHPIAVVGTQVCRSPHYVPPTGLLGEEDKSATLERWLQRLSQQRHADQRLRAAEDRYRWIFEAAADLILLVDGEGIISDCNNRAQEVLGYAPEELIGQPIDMIILPDYLATARVPLRRVLREGLACNDEHRLVRKDGSSVNVNVRSSALRDERGQRVQTVCIVQDVTGRRRLEQQLYQAQKMEAIGRLAGGMAHDFRNTLTVIGAYAHLVLSAVAPGDPLAEDLEQIRRASEQGESVVRQILAFSRRQPVVMRVLNLNEVLRDFLRTLPRLLGEDITIHTKLAQNLGNIRSDTGQIEQMIANLAANARDAMPRGGALTIETADVTLDNDYAAHHAGVAPGPYVMLSVSDTGVGMTEEVKEHLFEPFFTTKKRNQGTGLGLAVVYGIVRQNDGNIDVQSQPGQGTTFRIYFPRVEEPLLTARASRLDSITPGGTETILVVEDQAQVRNTVRRVLARLGYTVLEASDGAEALRLFDAQGEQVDLVLADVVLPGIGGPETVKQLRRKRQDFKVLYMSGYPDTVVANYGVEDGADLIRKPFSPKLLAERVRAILDAAPVSQERRLTSAPGDEQVV